MTGVREELAAGIAGGSNQHPASSNVKTARSWRAIVPFTHLGREGRMTVTIGRREFLAALGGAAISWPLATRAQQAAVPVVGVLSAEWPNLFSDRLRAFHDGLRETGYVEGRNLAIEYRWAEGQNDRLPALAAELVRRQVTVIVSTSTLRCSRHGRQPPRFQSCS